jgi:glycosyltransferase involved in cell wall biosynthesis
MPRMGNFLHIGLVTDSDAFAGTERHILDLAIGLRNKGSEVDIICPVKSPLASRAHEESLSIIPMEKRNGFDFDAVKLLRSLLIDGKIELFHAHNGRTALWAAMAKCAVSRGRVIATQHFLHPAHAERNGIGGAASRLGHYWLNQTLDHVIAISNAVRIGALQRGGIRSRKISVVHNGIRDPNRSRLRSPREIREALGIGNAPLLVCTARLQPEKDVATLIRAVQRLPSPRPFCVIAGEGSERTRLEIEIRCRNLADCVKLAGFQTDPLSLINAADLFILPSLAEPFGLVILEAMALGKPVIATRAGGPPEIVTDNFTGLLVPPENDEAMATAIRMLLADPEKANAMGRNGRERFLEHFTIDQMVNAIAPIYESLRASRK